MLIPRPPGAPRRGPAYQRLSASTVTTFTRELAELLAAGLPLLSAINLLVDSGVGRRSALLQAIHDRVAQGQSLSAVMQQFPRHFDMRYVRLVALGEASGQLADLLMRIANDRERRADQQAQWQQALMYPAFVCAVALGVAFALMLWAVPAFEQLFDNFDAPLPTLTVSVLWLSRGFATHAPMASIATVLGGVLLSASIRRSSRVRVACAQVIQRLPIIGALLMQIAVARWASSLAALLGAGMPLVDALMSIAAGDERRDRIRITPLRFPRKRARALSGGPIIESIIDSRIRQRRGPNDGPGNGLRGASGNDRERWPSDGHHHAFGFEHASAQLAQRLRAGDSFTAAIRHVGGFPPVVVRTIDIAEHTASLERMLADLGRRTHDDAQRRLRSLMRLIEPAIITVAGAFVAVLVLSLYLPIIKLGDVV